MSYLRIEHTEFYEEHEAKHGRWPLANYYTNDNTYIGISRSSMNDEEKMTIYCPQWVNVQFVDGLEEAAWFMQQELMRMKRDGMHGVFPAHTS